MFKSGLIYELFFYNGNFEIFYKFMIFFIDGTPGHTNLIIYDNFEIDNVFILCV